MLPYLYFIDPVQRAPTLGCMLMCLSASLVGVIVFLRKQSLLGETLSHASYPGVIMGVMVAGSFGFESFWEKTPSLFILGGAFLTALAGLWAIHFLEKKAKIRNDSALCFVLSAFFGIGLTLASEVQFSHTALYRQAQSYLYGQAATMNDTHVFIYGLLALFVLTIILLFYKEIQALTFDRQYARSLGIPALKIEGLIFLLIVLAVVIGIRSVGVVLMSAMFIAPAVAARQFTHKLHYMLFLAALFGLASGFLGNYVSVESSRYLSLSTGKRLVLPTGPTIVIIASLFCLISLLAAPERGLIIRIIRIALFRTQCMLENILKSMWRRGSQQELHISEIKQMHGINTIYLQYLLAKLVRQGYLVDLGGGGYSLSQLGRAKGEKIIRMHRLWEVYLADYLGIGAERVHKSAEEMEHIMTPELERELTLLLNDPKEDPHHQPIPPLNEIL